MGEGDAGRIGDGTGKVTQSGRIVVSREPRSSPASDIIFLSPDEHANISDAHTATEGFFDRTLPIRSESSASWHTCIQRTNLGLIPKMQSRWPAASSRSNC
jgi:hypothetical protein